MNTCNPKNAHKDSTYKIEVLSYGPYLSSNYIQIMQNTNVNILWKRFSGVQRINNKYKNSYENIDLGNHIIKKNDYLDIENKYYPFSTKPYRSLKIGDNLINPKKKGTSSDIYIITFNENTEYIEYTDSYVDH